VAAKSAPSGPSETPVSPEVRHILDRCERLRAQTNGYFDAYPGGTLDPSGLVEGWAVDRASDLLDGGRRARIRGCTGDGVVDRSALGCAAARLRRAAHPR
jgi:hypothetical protein